MKQIKKNTSGVGVVNKLKKIVTSFVNFIKETSKKKYGKFSGTHVMIGGVLVAILLFMVLGGIMGNDDVDYPVIYNNTDGDLYLMSTKVKKEENAVKLANGESSSNAVYANTTNRYVLFKKSGALYLYDSKKKDETIKLVADVKAYKFTDDDKYVVALDKDEKLKIYNYKEVKTVEKDVTSIIAMSEDKLLFEKENVLYVRSANPRKDDKLKVTEEYDTYTQFSEDGENILYIDDKRNLHLFDISKDEDTVISEKVSTYFCDTKSCEKLFYVESDDTKTIYYYDGKEKVKMFEGVYSIHDYNVEKKQILFSTLVDGKYDLYYQKVGKEAVVVEEKLASLRMPKLFEGKDIYYITGDDELRYVKISGSKLGNVKTVGTDVSGYLFLHKKGYVFIGNVEKNSNGTLYLAKGGKVKTIDEEVNANLVTISKDGSDIYYMKDYNTSGDLYVSKGGKGKEISKDVYNYEYIKDDLIYFIKDYSVSKSKGDLYRYSRKATLVAEDVTRITNSPVYYEAEK